MKTNLAAWSGSMMLGFGWALLDARIGENRPHSHLAHQISLALVDVCSISADRNLRLSPGEAVLIPAATVHRLMPSGAILRNLYVDPFFMGTRDLNKSVGLERVSAAEANALALVQSGKDARKWIEGFLNRKSSRRIDPRLGSTLQRIEPGAAPSELAKAVGVSTTRMREIAVRDFGVPTTKLLQWLQVQRAIEGFHQSHSLAAAAAAGGFSDQAHFTRRLVEWFGVTPSQGLAKIEITIVR
ncbi:MAG: helix-turn-helix transcriptional regulator [Alteraurantiacibacter sp. bin_em_oilr2.035]|nr:helix-turn-helix transcriptional regulator [Alteraurantiacibacter sp. bin_em_oilr2.035]